LTDAAKVTERFRRPDFGHLEIEVTINDAKAYTTPWTVTVHQRIMVDTELIEFVCQENEQDAPHQLQTTQQDFAELFQSLTPARVVMEVGTHSGWVRDVVAGCGHEVLVANPRQMDGPKRRKRKNDRIDAHKLARVGRIDPQSLFPLNHRSVEVRQDLVTVRARNAVVAVRKDLIRDTGLVKTMGGDYASVRPRVSRTR
jgi:Transposase